MRKNYPLYFIWPALILYTVLFIYPSFIGIGYSFTDWNRYTHDISFIGLENFKNIFLANKPYLKYILNTLMFTLVSNIVKIIPALFLAIMLGGTMRARNFYRSVMFFPYVLSTLVVCIIFKAMMNPRNGLINQLLEFIGLGFMKQKWLADPKWVWPSIFFVDAWKGIGYVMTIFVAGLQSIPRSYYEAADIDGASFFQQLINVTIPMLMPSIMVNIVFGLTYGLKVFDIIYALTNGGPGRLTEVLNTAIFTEIGAGNLSMASALSTLQFALMCIVGFFVIRMMMKKEVEA